MQSDIKDIYKITSSRTGVSEQIYKDLGNFIFKDVKSNLEKPKSLIIKLKGIGYWYLKLKKMKEAISYFPLHYEIDGFSDFPSEQALLKFINKQELYKIFKARLLDYQDYITIKEEIKILKDEFKKVHSRKKKGDSSCKD